MRIFWTIIALLALATVAMLLVRGRAAPPAPPPIQTADTPRPTPPVERTTPPPAVVEQQPPPPAPDPAPPTPTPPVAVTPAPVEDPNPAPAVELPAVPERDAAVSTEHLKPGFIGPPPPGAAEAATRTDTAEQPAAATPSETAANGAAPAAINTAPATGAREPSAADSAAIAAAQGPARLEPQPDGTVLVDGRFVMRGDGTRDKPYEVTWEHLMSVQETYKPRMGLKVIPDRVQMLHNKWVKISGYVAFPVMAEGLDEMLMMLNQWDGCCIGVPPTPYDAIEVKLEKPAEGETRLLIMGTVTGRLQVDPYLVKDWLVSLYLMDETVVSKQTGAPLRESEVRQEHLAP